MAQDIIKYIFSSFFFIRRGIRDHNKKHDFSYQIQYLTETCDFCCLFMYALLCSINC